MKMYKISCFFPCVLYFGKLFVSDRASVCVCVCGEYINQSSQNKSS